MKDQITAAELEAVGKMLSSRNLKDLKQAIMVLQELVNRAEETENPRAAGKVNMDTEFHEMIDRVASKLATGNAASIREAVEQLENLHAGADVECREAFLEWRKSGGPVGPEKLSLMAKRYVIGQLLADARRLVRNIGENVIRMGGNNTLTLARASNIPGTHRLDFIGAEMSFREIDEAITHALTQESANYYYWPVATYRKSVIYEQTERLVTGGYGETKLYRRAYTINDDDTVTLADKRSEVVKKMEYVDAIRVEHGQIRLVKTSQ